MGIPVPATTTTKLADKSLEARQEIMTMCNHSNCNHQHQVPNPNNRAARRRRDRNAQARERFARQRTATATALVEDIEDPADDDSLHECPDGSACPQCGARGTELFHYEIILWPVAGHPAGVEAAPQGQVHVISHAEAEAIRRRLEAGKQAGLLEKYMVRYLPLVYPPGADADARRETWIAWLAGGGAAGSAAGSAAAAKATVADGAAARIHRIQ